MLMVRAHREDRVEQQEARRKAEEEEERMATAVEAGAQKKAADEAADLGHRTHRAADHNASARAQRRHVRARGRGGGARDALRCPEMP